MTRREQLLRHYEEQRDTTQSRVKDGIERYRKGKVCLRFADKDVHPLSFLRFKAVLERHDFLFGCNLFGLDQLGDDKASLNKLNGRYYLSFGGFYAVSDSVYGPYKYIGHTGASIDHTSFCEWNGQLFNAITIVDHFGEYRSSGLCYAHIRRNGELVTDPLIVEYGVGQYDSNWNRIEAELFMGARNVRKVENEDLFGFSLSANAETVLYYPKIRNLTEKKGFAVNYDCVGGSGSIELREKDENGRLLGEIKIDHPSSLDEQENRGNPFSGGIARQYGRVFKNKTGKRCGDPD